MMPVFQFDSSCITMRWSTFTIHTVHACEVEISYQHVFFNYTFASHLQAWSRHWGSCRRSAGYVLIGNMYISIFDAHVSTLLMQIFFFLMKYFTLL